MYRIAIQPDHQNLMSGRHQSFSKRWLQLAAAAGHEAKLVDAYDPDFMAQLDGCDGFMWWFAHLPHPRNFGRRLLTGIEHGRGMPAFPNWQTVWHFDDKISQKYLLDAAGIPTPRTWVFWRYDDAMAFCKTASYPLVIKLLSGIVSENVRLLRGFDEASYWAGQLWGPGVTSLDRPRVRGPRDAYGRLRAAAKMLLRGRPPNPGRRTEVQKGYLLLQAFLDGNEFDTRITIIGNRAFGFRRFNRPGDFRASGSGRIDFDPAKIDAAAVRLAFRAARHLRTQSLAVDVLYDNGRPVLSEISYYYEGWALAECAGHWALSGDDAERGELAWVEGSVSPEDAIFADFLELLASRRAATAT